MGFLAPWFLAGALAVGLPVFVHLLRRQTTTPRPVSSLMFFERGTQSSVRHRRLRYLLLFALRTLAVLLLALAFARPYFKHKAVLASDKLLLVAVDDSFSMNAKAGAGTKLDEAKRQALEVLAHKSAGQKAQVIELGGQMKLLTQPVADASQLRAAVEAIQPGDGHATFGELGRGMRAMAETVHTPMELDLFSDMQESNMPGNFADMVMPGNVELKLHRIGEQKTAADWANWNVESVQAPGQLVDTKKARVIAVIAGHGTPAATRVAELVVNGKAVATKKVDVPADGRATVVFDGLDVPYGESRCAVRIGSGEGSADAFASDDQSWFAVKRADPERVLFVHRGDDTRSPLYFGAALGAAAQAEFVLQPITPEEASDIDPTKYAFVVLSDVPQIPSILEHTLERNVEAGGNVLVATGLAESRRQAIPVWGGKVEDSHFYSQSAAGFATVGEMDGAHPAMRDANGWQGTKFFYVAAVDPGNARVVAKLGDGTPLVMDKQMGEGHVLLLASGLDNVANDLPLNPAFVAFVDQAAKYLSGEERASGARVVDSYVQLRNPVGAAGGKVSGATVDIIGPDGRRPLSLREAAAAQSFQLEHAGFYQVRFANGRDALLAVNPDPRESDLATIPDETLKLWSGAAGTSETNSTAAASEEAADNSVSGLWWWVMLLLTITALAGTGVASGYLGTQREQP
ncbi:MAG TPA: BatA and WFA domain-containing protein [Acidobacteriaceae bacterium]|nr:BatA and WFA domain-containing protein [Acidobacteriaceae bacterium]